MKVLIVDTPVIGIDHIREVTKMVPAPRIGRLRIEQDTFADGIAELASVPLGGTISVSSWDYDLHTLYMIMRKQALWTFTKMEVVGTCSMIDARRIRPLNPGKPRHWGIVRNWPLCEVIRG